MISPKNVHYIYMNIVANKRNSNRLCYDHCDGIGHRELAFCHDHGDKMNHVCSQDKKLILLLLKPIHNRRKYWFLHYDIVFN